MNNKLKELNQENNVIFIYFTLLIIYLYANKLEVDYLEYKNEKDKETYRLLLYIVFGVSFIITLYYTINSINDLSFYENERVYELKKLSSIANIVVLIATLRYLS